MDRTGIDIHEAPQRSSFWQKLGPGGLTSFLLAFAVGLGGLALPWVVCIRRVLKHRHGHPWQGADAILVLGRRLVRDEPTEVFQARLAEAAALFRAGAAPRVIVAGGVTGRATRSEAEAGLAWLRSAGIPEAALVAEGRSQHTLENLFYVREDLRRNGWTRLILVSDPLHLARAGALARGLGLQVVCRPAQNCPPRPGSGAWLGRVATEGFLLLWYHTGMAYSRVIRSRRQLARVT